MDDCDPDDETRWQKQTSRRLMRVETIVVDTWNALNDLKEILMSTQDTINADTQAIQQAVTELNSAKATLQAEFNALVAANPTIDTSGLGAAVAALEPAVQAVAAVGPAPAIQSPPTGTSGGAIPQPATTTPGDPGPQPPVDPAAPVA